MMVNNKHMENINTLYKIMQNQVNDRNAIDQLARIVVDVYDLLQEHTTELNQHYEQLQFVDKESDGE